MKRINFYLSPENGLIVFIACCMNISLGAAENSLCNGKLFLPQVNTSDGSAYSAWLLQQGNEFVLQEGGVKAISTPDLAIKSAVYSEGKLHISQILFSPFEQTQAYHADLSLLAGSDPWRFRLDNVQLESSQSIQSKHACVSAFHKPQVVKINNHYHIRYELLLQNLAPLKNRIEKIQVLQHEKIIADYQGEELAKLLSTHPGDDLVFAFITAETEQAPERLVNRVSIVSKQTEETSIRDYEIGIDPSPVREIAAPVKQGVWYFGELGDHEHHAKFLDFTYAHPLNSQRWAVDLLKVWLDEEELCLGNCTRNDQFAAYAEPFYAVDDGTIIAVNNGVADNLPGQLPASLNINDYAGNYILQDLGDGIYALYAHALIDSLKVSVGDSIKVGQVLGKIGNSGNSTAPHLHFHLAKLNDTRQIFNAQGVPFVISEFITLEPWNVIHRQEMPADDSLVLFE